MTAAAPICARPRSFDHELLVSGDPAESERLRAGLAAYSAGDLCFVHDSKFWCCRTENVPTTLARLAPGQKKRETAHARIGRLSLSALEDRSLVQPTT